MAINYPDRRSRYSGVFPWEAAQVVSSVPAVRGTAPREAFRVTTAEPPRNPETEWVQNEKGEWVQEPVKLSPPSAPHTSDNSLQALAGQKTPHDFPERDR